MAQNEITANNSERSPTRGQIRVGVTICLANESETVDELLRRVLAQLNGDDRVYCVLDNASKDDTRQKVQAYSERDSRVVLIWAPENRGAVDAFFRGYRAAFEDQCRFILEMDGGLSHQPEEIPKFLQAMEQGADYAGGSRFIRGGSHRGSFKRYMISRGGTFLTNLLVGTHMHDMTSGFECFSRPAMEKVLHRGTRSRAHFFQTEIRYLMHQFRWVEIPINYCNPSKSVGKATLKDAFRSLWQLRKEAKAARKR